MKSNGWLATGRSSFESVILWQFVTGRRWCAPRCYTLWPTRGNLRQEAFLVYQQAFSALKSAKIFQCAAQWAGGKVLLQNGAARTKSRPFFTIVLLSGGDGTITDTSENLETVPPTPRRANPPGALRATHTLRGQAVSISVRQDDLSLPNSILDSKTAQAFPCAGQRGDNFILQKGAVCESRRILSHNSALSSLETLEVLVLQSSENMRRAPAINDRLILRAAVGR